MQETYTYTLYDQVPVIRYSIYNYLNTFLLFFFFWFYTKELFVFCDLSLSDTMCTELSVCSVLYECFINSKIHDHNKQNYLVSDKHCIIVPSTYENENRTLIVIKFTVCVLTQKKMRTLMAPVFTFTITTLCGHTTALLL